MVTPAKPPVAPNPGIPGLLELLGQEEVNPNEVYVSAWKEMKSLIGNDDKESLTASAIACRAISIYHAAVKNFPEIMGSHVRVPAGAFGAHECNGNGSHTTRESQNGGIFAPKRQSMEHRLPRPENRSE